MCVCVCVLASRETIAHVRLPADGRRAGLRFIKLTKAPGSSGKPASSTGRVGSGLSSCTWAGEREEGTMRNKGARAFEEAYHTHAAALECEEE